MASTRFCTRNGSKVGYVDDYRLRSEQDLSSSTPRFPKVERIAPSSSKEKY